MKVLMNTLGRFLAKRGRGARSRATLLSLLVALSALAPSGVWGYTSMGSDRVLLMNNDGRLGATITYQGYYDTNTANKTYWVHDKTAAGFGTAANLLKGTNHTFYKNDGTILWNLTNCRAGSGTVVNDAKRNYIPWSSTAKSIIDNKNNIPSTSTGVKGVGGVIFRNSTTSCLNSPYYEEGIGTIYFDAVNVFVNVTTGSLALEIATNVTEEAAANGVTLSSITNNYADADWQPCSFDILKVENSATATLVETGATNIVLDVTGGGSSLFYRVRAHLNYYAPIRFRIRRLNQTGGAADTTGLLLVDNVMASYPPMTAVLHRYGTDYDDALTGANVIGCLGDFDTPLLNFRQQNVRPRMWFEFVTNTSSIIAAKIVNPRLVYRWRYLNQVCGAWKEIPFSPTTVSTTTFATSNLVGSTALDLTDGVGDLEYYFTTEIDAPYYQVRDYAFKTAVGYGTLPDSTKAWTEKISSLTLAANYSAEDIVPSCGTDYFVRIREAESPYEWVKLCTTVTTNHTAGVTREDVRMELVSTNTWRYCYYVPTNAVGETLRFHFEGRRLAVSPTDPFAYVATTNIWKADLTEVPYLPYTSVAGTSFSRDVAVTLDDAGTHLVIEFNDDNLAFSVTHGTYQSFNTWTDALVGYRGNASYNEENPTNGASATGVSDAKRKYAAEMFNWNVQGYTDNDWRENFNTTDTTNYPLNVSFNSTTTPLNGWTAAHGQWVRGARGATASATAANEVSLQLEGRGQGYVALEKDSGMPAGVGTVTFAARVAQAPSFNDFATYLGGNMLQNYALSAKVTMSRQKTANLNPTDISPAQPSVSFVGYYRATKGCYEFRITRTADNELTCGLYKWKPSASGMTATLLKSKVLKTTDFNNNMLVPSTGDKNGTYSPWTSGYLYLFNKGTSEVQIECMLANVRNSNTIDADSANLKAVISYTDSDQPYLKGTYGVGSTDCNAAFGALMYHLPSDAGDLSKGPNLKGTSQKDLLGSDDWAEEWAFFPDRWQQLKGTANWGDFGSLGATIPTNQTIRLQFKDDDRGWFDSGYEVSVSSFSTNRYAFAPCVSPDYKVRLITGGNTYDEVRTDVAVDDIEITAWRAGDFDGLTLGGTYGQADQWVYTSGTVETMLDMVQGNEPTVTDTVTNGYELVFSATRKGLDYNSTFSSFRPKEPLTVTWVQLVGGGGVTNTYDLSARPVTIATNALVQISVGAKEDGKAGEATTITSPTLKYTASGGTAEGVPGEVRLHVTESSKVCALQPARGEKTSAMGLRSPYLAAGMSMFSFDYRNAHSNCVLLLQACIGTNGVSGTRMQGRTSMSASLTKEAPTTNYVDGADWVTLTNFTFSGMSAKERASGTKSYYMSLRAPVLGFLRLVMSPEIIDRAMASEGDTERDVTDGSITITKISCYNEPKLDMRSWWGWNLHTEGWNTDDKQYAYLFDSPEGLSASLNFSALKTDNASADARGIGLAQPELQEEYAKDNSFVQCPPLTNGIGTVTFRARTFTTNQTQNSWVTLYGSSEPDAYQPEVPETWKQLAAFEITNTTYQTFKWSTTDDNTKISSVRLEVAASRHGRNGTGAKDWETPPVTPIQRVWVDEITASEPVVPRLLFRDVRPFRSHIADLPASPVTNVTDQSEQPILGECWGLQATVEPQQMSDELVTTSVVVYAAFYRGISPWGYEKWKDKAEAVTVQLEQVASNLVFRSTYNNASSVIGPDMTPNGVFPNNVWQYTVWAEYLDKQGVAHKHTLEASEWAPPAWYYGIDDLNSKYGAGAATFVGYTFLDTISPSRAWINEVNVCDTYKSTDYENQYVELAVPQGADLKGWRLDILDRNLQRGTIARFGSGNATVTSKTGVTPGTDCTNHYTFISLRSPTALSKGGVAGADGTWLKTPIDSATYKSLSSLSLNGGDLKNYEAYGLSLVRPSGVIEHQIIFSGTNYYAGKPLEYLGSGTNLLGKVKAVDGDDSHWFYAGQDENDGSLGVFRSHGEDVSCWTNWMVQTPSALNRLRDGTLQEIDADWFLQPNGTNVWIYATVLDEHISQRIGSNTNRVAVVIVRKGTSTNIVYTTAPWYQIGSVMKNGAPVAEAQGRAKRSDTPGHQWTLKLENVEETVNVTAASEPSQDVTDAGLDPNDPYYNAVMQWLASFGEDSEIHRAELWSLADKKEGDLDIRDMYWLNINPLEEGWVLKAGMGGVTAGVTSARPGRSSSGGGASLAAVVPTESYDANGSLTNVRVLVTMMITNTASHAAYAPNCLQGLEPGSSSADYGINSANWTSVTFKVCGALQREGVKNDFQPLRWFVFGPNSFDENFRARIEIRDPHVTSSPGYSYGWSDYPDVPIFYKWKLDATPPKYDTTEMLKADSTYH